MRGHIAKKGNRYYVVIDRRDPETNRRRPKWYSGYRTKKEAEAALATILHEMQQGIHVEPSKQTLTQFVTDWLASMRATVRPSTWDSYRMNTQRHVIPRLGDIQLRRLTPSHLNRFYADLLERGRTDGTGGLSPKTVHYIHTILHRALRDAVRWQMVQRNVADLADPPQHGKREMKVWSVEQLRRFLNSTSDRRLHAAYFLAATTGMRRGEVLGLRWADVDLDGGRIQIRQSLIVVDYKLTFSTPKTARSVRSLSLDPATVAVLRSHRGNQLKDRLAWGGGYEDSGLVFTRENGSPLHPQIFSQSFERAVKGAELPAIRFHDLRHTYATVALATGVHPKVVSERLGHSSITVTLDTYSHVIPSMQEEAASRIAASILGT